MDLRVVVLIADRQLGDLVRTQVENLGCRCSLVGTYEEASVALSWAEAAVVDLADDGVDSLNRLRVEAPTLRTLAIAPDADHQRVVEEVGADQILVEPFSVADLVDAVRALGQRAGASGGKVVDLRTGEHSTAAKADDAPWWATR